MSILRWGVLSTARIATEKVIPAICESRHGRVVAVASRDADRARATAELLGISRAHGSYAALLEDADVDAVYNPLPNHLHVPWSIRALEAGKHVLCEKPLGLDAADAERLADAARLHPRLKVMEAFMYRFHPQWQQARRLVEQGTIGRLRAVQTVFSFFNDDPDNIRNAAELGGGALMDVGCYGLSVARWLFDAEPRRVLGAMETDPRFDVDRLTTAMLAFDAGTATVICSTQAARHQRVDVLGTEGRLAIDVPFNAPPDRPCRIVHERDGTRRILETGPADPYTLQADAFARAVLDEAPVPTPLADALANMRVLDAVRESARSGAWVTP